MKTNQNHLKETRQNNLLALKKTIDNNSFEELISEDKDWGGAYVIITSSPERVFNPETDKDDWFGRRSSCTYVLTKHSMILSNFFYYVRDNIMGDTDNYLYGFMALLAKDFMVDYDEAGSIGKRYRREDEIGTPFCITYDFDSENDGCVTVRDRDTMEQVRLPIDELSAFLRERVSF